MIVGELFKKQLKQLENDHPNRILAHCMNAGQVKNPCSVCLEICPEGVYSGRVGRKANFSACSNCNMCVSSCPTRCIAPSAYNAVEYLRVLDLSDSQIVISACRDNNVQLNVPSMASLPWEFLACLGLKKQVVLIPGHLSSKEKALFTQTLTRLILFFGKETYEQHFKLIASAQEIPQVEISRREMFWHTWEDVKQRVDPRGKQDIINDGLLYYNRLAKQLDQIESKRRYGFLVPRIGEGCTGCGVCTLMCPQKAMSIQKNEIGFSIILDLRRCNTCGLCEKSCIEHAISGMGLAQLKDMTPIHLFRGVNQ